MAISEDEVARLHKANKPSAQVHLRTDTAKLIVYSYVECELQFVCGRFYKHHSNMDTQKDDWRVRKGLNVLCMCRYAEIEDWPTKYRRVLTSAMQLIYYLNIRGFYRKYIRGFSIGTGTLLTVIIILNIVTLSYKTNNQSFAG